MNRHAGVSGRSHLAGSGLLPEQGAWYPSISPRGPARQPPDPDHGTEQQNSLHNPDNNVRAAGLDTLRKAKGVEQRPEFRAAMEQLHTI